MITNERETNERVDPSKKMVANAKAHFGCFRIKHYAVNIINLAIENDKLTSFVSTPLAGALGWPGG